MVFVGLLPAVHSVVHGYRGMLLLIGLCTAFLLGMVFLDTYTRSITFFKRAKEEAVHELQAHIDKTKSAAAYRAELVLRSLSRLGLNPTPQTSSHTREDDSAHDGEAGTAQC